MRTLHANENAIRVNKAERSTELETRMLTIRASCYFSQTAARTGLEGGRSEEGF